MKNNGFDSFQLLALVPHRDVRVSLRAWSALLFSEGGSGAWSFPWVMPIAAFKRPLSGPELKSRALMLRRTIDLSCGKFTTGPLAVAAISDNVSVFGPAVNIGLSEGFFAFDDNAVLRRFSPLVIGCALCQSDAMPDVKRPSLSFRAAALANMCFRPMPSGTRNDYSYEWEIDKLYWLPKH